MMKFALFFCFAVAMVSSSPTRSMEEGPPGSISFDAETWHKNLDEIPLASDVRWECPAGLIWSRKRTTVFPTCEYPYVEQSVFYQGCACPNGMIFMQSPGDVNVKTLHCIWPKNCPNIIKSESAPASEANNDKPVVINQRFHEFFMAMPGDSWAPKNESQIEHLKGIPRYWQCPPGTVWTECRPQRLPTCDRPHKFVYDKKCWRGCACPKDMVFLESPNFNKHTMCIKTGRCPNICPRGKHWDYNTITEEESCQNRKPKKSRHTQGCRCPPGQIPDESISDECVYPKDC